MEEAKRLLVLLRIHFIKPRTTSLFWVSQTTRVVVVLVAGRTKAVIRGVPPASAMSRAGGQESCKPGAWWDNLLRLCIQSTQSPSVEPEPRGRCRRPPAVSCCEFGLRDKLGLSFSNWAMALDRIWHLLSICEWDTSRSLLCPNVSRWLGACFQLELFKSQFVLLCECVCLI